MLAWLLLAQLTTASGTSPESTYSSAALRDFITAVASENRRVPSALARYHAHVESELGLIGQDSLGREHLAQVEQYAASAVWTSREGYRLHVLGYRSPPFAMTIAWLPRSPGWLAPNLFGDRLPFTFIERTRRSASGGRVIDSIVPVHPFASDRERWYRYSGGDTVTTLRVRGRSIPIVLVKVVPLIAAGGSGAAFLGDIYVDASRHQIVRLRGRFMRVLPENDRREQLARATATALAVYVDITNEDVDERFWLPSTERIELQLGSGLMGGWRYVARLVARITDYTVDSAAAPMQAGVAELQGENATTFAAGDSLRRFGDWRAPLGAATRHVAASDFPDLVPPLWGATGRPQLLLEPTQFARLFHFDRVEGFFTGAEAAMHLRDAVPGLTARAFGGWGWTERSARFGGALTWQRGRWTSGAHAQRALENTDDFPIALPFFANGFGSPLGSSDDHDYVDRTIAALSQSRTFANSGGGVATIQLGLGRDRGEIARVDHAMFLSKTPFRANRGSADGRYGRATIDLDMSPGTLGTAATDIGGRLHYEIAAGQLDWQRLTATLEARRSFGALTLVQRADAGLVSGNAIPPQQLFEVGGVGGRLGGYPYKRFAGDRVALARTFVSHTLPIASHPQRVLGWIHLPAFAPALAASLDGAWTSLSTASGRTAAADLVAPLNGARVPDVTYTVRGSVGFGLTFFSGLLHAGFARPLDPNGAWQRSFSFGTVF